MLTLPGRPTGATRGSEEVTLPLRGKPLRDRYVLRLIAIDRVLHFLVLSSLAAAVFLFASHKAALNADFTRILHDLQGGLGGPMAGSRHGIVHDLQRESTLPAWSKYAKAKALVPPFLLASAPICGPRRASE